MAKKRQAIEGEHQGKPRSGREQAVFLFVLILFILVSIYLDRNSAVPYVGKCISLSTGWVSETDEVVDLTALPGGNLNLTKDIGGLYSGDKSFCLKSIDTMFDVYAGGTLIYSYRPEIPKRLGASYGMYVHTIPLPENTAVLGLHLHPAFPETPAALHDVVIEDGGQYMGNLYRENLWHFGRSTVILLIGLLFLTLGVFGKIIMNSARLDFISFGILCVLIGIIGCNDTLLLQVLTRHPSLIRVITYVALIFLPYPAVSFFASAVGQSRSKLVPASLLLSLSILQHRYC